MVIEQSLAGPVGILVKFSTLQDYGVDKVFFLENKNIDNSQKNIVFLVGGEKPSVCVAVAGMYVRDHFNRSLFFKLSNFHTCIKYGCRAQELASSGINKVYYVDYSLFYLISQHP